MIIFGGDLFDKYLQKYPDANEQVFQFEGGPGTGKSFVLNFILQAFFQSQELNKILNLPLH